MTFDHRFSSKILLISERHPPAPWKQRENRVSSKSINRLNPFPISNIFNFQRLKNSEHSENGNITKRIESVVNRKCVSIQISKTFSFSEYLKIQNFKNSKISEFRNLRNFRERSTFKKHKKSRNIPLHQRVLRKDPGTVWWAQQPSPLQLIC